VVEVPEERVVLTNVRKLIRCEIDLLNFYSLLFCFSIVLVLEVCDDELHYGLISNPVLLFKLLNRFISLKSLFWDFELRINYPLLSHLGDDFTALPVVLENLKVLYLFFLILNICLKASDIGRATLFLAKSILDLLDYLQGKILDVYVQKAYVLKSGQCLVIILDFCWFLLQGWIVWLSYCPIVGRSHRAIDLWPTPLRATLHRRVVVHIL